MLTKTFNTAQDTTYSDSSATHTQWQTNATATANPNLGTSHSNNANQGNQLANVTLKQEVIKIPEFYGQTNKDTVSAMDFISRVDECQISNDWNDITTFTNFQLVYAEKLKNA
jgi:hypothetical protein